MNEMTKTATKFLIEWRDSDFNEDMESFDTLAAYFSEFMDETSPRKMAEEAVKLWNQLFEVQIEIGSIQAEFFLSLVFGGRSAAFKDIANSLDVDQKEFEWQMEEFTSHAPGERNTLTLGKFEELYNKSKQSNFSEKTEEEQLNHYGARQVMRIVSQ